MLVALGSLRNLFGCTQRLRALAHQRHFGPMQQVGSTAHKAGLVT